MKADLADFFRFQMAIRDFFLQRDFLDVVTPPIVDNPGIEPHIRPFFVPQAKGYLHTSPEFHMKNLLSLGLDSIFTLSYCFRDEPISSTHRPQFLMLEWYRANADYWQIGKDCQELFHAVGLGRTIEYKSVDKLFQEVLNISILDYLDCDELRKLLEKKYSDIHLPEESLDWEDYYFLLFLNKVEPCLKEYPALLLYEFPHHLNALAKVKEDDPRVCKRFEIYLKGIELCNCFEELTDLSELIRRVKNLEQKRFRLYHYQLPPPGLLYQAMERGLPPSSGIALGVERFYQALTGKNFPYP